MRVGVIADLHLPHDRPGYLEFVQDSFEAWQVDKIVFIGDVIDFHAISFHDIDPHGRSAEDERCEALQRLDAWKESFPEALVTIGNHDARAIRKAQAAGIPSHFLKDYAEVWDTPSWDWQLVHEVEGVLYEHGTGTSGKDAAYNRAIERRQSVVMGHTHTYPGVKWHCGPRDMIFGVNVGAAIDDESYAAAYALFSARKSVPCCGVILDGSFPYVEPMRYHRRSDPYHRSKFARGKRRNLSR